MLDLAIHLYLVQYTKHIKNLQVVNKYQWHLDVKGQKSVAKKLEIINNQMQSEYNYRNSKSYSL